MTKPRQVSKPRQATGAYRAALDAADPAPELPAELDPVARAALEAQPRRADRRNPRHGRLAQPGIVQVNIALPAELRLRLKRHAEAATLAAQARDPLAPTVTMSGIVERLVADYLERVGA